MESSQVPPPAPPSLLVGRTWQTGGQVGPRETDLLPLQPGQVLFVGQHLALQGQLCLLLLLCGLLPQLSQVPLKLRLSDFPVTFQPLHFHCEGSGVSSWCPLSFEITHLGGGWLPTLLAHGG